METAASDYGGDSVKVVGVQDTNLEDCMRQARRGQVLLTRRGKPVAVLIDVRGLDREQAELGVSDAFWSLIRERRKQRTVSPCGIGQAAGQTVVNGESRDTAKGRQRSSGEVRDCHSKLWLSPCAPCQGGALQRVQIPPGNFRSGR